MDERGAEVRGVEDSGERDAQLKTLHDSGHRSQGILSRAIEIDETACFALIGSVATDAVETSIGAKRKAPQGLSAFVKLVTYKGRASANGMTSPKCKRVMDS